MIEESRVPSALRRLSEDESAGEATGMLVILVSERDDAVDYCTWSLGLNAAEAMAYASLAAEQLTAKFYGQAEEVT